MNTPPLTCVQRRAITSLAIGLMVFCGCASTTGSSRAEWWFPTQAPPSGMLRYTVRHTTTTSYSNSPPSKQVSTGVCDVTISADPLADGEGMSIRPAGEIDLCETDTLLGIWVWYLQMMHEWRSTDSQITPTEFAFGGGPILRGPWRTDDRILFSWWMFVGGIVHAEVRSVDDTTIRLAFDFWGGPAEPDWRGSGEIVMANDPDGLREAHARWSWTYRSSRTEETVTVKRRYVETTGPAPSGL